MIETVRLTISLGTVRLKIFKSRFPFKRSHISMTRRAALVVLTPPPVEPGEASDEHEDHHQEDGRIGQQSYIYCIESGCPRRYRLEEGS